MSLKFMSFGSLASNYWCNLISSKLGALIISDSTSDAHGNIYAAASLYRGSNLESMDICAIKLSPYGEVLWLKAFPANSFRDDSSQITCDSSGNFWIAGRYGVGTYSGHSVLSKVSSDGTVSWMTQLQNPLNNSSLSALNVDASGNTLGCGGGSVAGGWTAAHLYKVSSSGSILWQTSMYNTNGNNGFSGLVTASDGSIYCCGYTDTAGANRCLVLAKFNSSGVLQWQRKLGGNSSYATYATGIVLSADESRLFVLGGADQYPETSALLMSVSNVGTLEWVRRVYESGKYLPPFGIVRENDDIYICAGNGHVLGLTAKFTTTGTLVWQRGSTSTSNNIAYRNPHILSQRIVVCGMNYYNSQTIGYLACLPQDGGFLGVHGPFTHSASSFLIDSPTFSLAAGSFTTSSPGFTATISSPILDNIGFDVIRIPV